MANTVVFYQFQIVSFASIFGISALPFETYSGVSTANLQPIYWVGSPSSGQFSYGSPVKQVSSLYRDAAPAGPTLPASAQHSPTHVVAFAHDAPSVKPNDPNTSGYTLISPASPSTIPGQNGQPGLPWIRSDMSASNGIMPKPGDFSPPTFPQINIENSNPLDSKMPPATSGTQLESTKESTKTAVMPRVTIFAPGSLIGSDLIHTVLNKSSEESGIGVFIYAPGSLLISQNEAELAKFSFLGQSNLFPGSSIQTQQKISNGPTLAPAPASLDLITQQVNTPSELSESGKIMKNVEKENSKEEEEDDDEKD